MSVLCVLGYYRSGTTHLHYVLSCDPGMVTPRWYQVLAPQGWVVSWAFLRWFLVPFLGSTRPQDDVAIGPEWPAEDDFALCNWTLSSPMPGRMVLPREWGRGKAEGEGREARVESGGWRGWRTLHDLGGASEQERARWAWAVWGFAWKVSRAGGRRGRRVILKTPSHTARVRELLEVFGPERVKFIHIARDPAAVLRSNVAMHERFEPYLLQDAVSPDEVRRRIIEEYDATERKFLDECGLIPPGSLARMRYQDLVADPMGELRRVYAELGLSWSGELEERFARYLRSVADYRSAGARTGTSPRPTEETPPELAWMLERFGHDRPAKPRAEGADDPGRAAGDRPATALAVVIDSLIVALVWAAAWIGLAWVMRDRLDWLTWPTGVIMGTTVLRLAGRGAVRWGLWAAALTLGVLAAAAYPATCLAFYRDRTPMPWGDVWDSTRDGLLAINNLVWVFLGVFTAYRFASRKHVRPPGA